MVGSLGILIVPLGSVIAAGARCTVEKRALESNSNPVMRGCQTERLITKADERVGQRDVGAVVVVKWDRGL